MKIEKGIIPVVYLKQGDKEVTEETGLIVNDLIGIYQINDADEGVFFELIAVKSGARICYSDYISHAIELANELANTECKSLKCGYEKFNRRPTEEEIKLLKSIVEKYKKLDSELSQTETKKHKEEKEQRIKSAINSIIDDLRAEIECLLLEEI